MKINDILSELHSPNITSLLLFVLYKMKDDEKYKCLSELSFVLDKTNLINLCTVFGGTTITIPTIDELENLFNALLLYKLVDIDKQWYERTLQAFEMGHYQKADMVKCYEALKKVLSDYSIAGTKNDNE